MSRFLILDSNKKSYIPAAFVECAVVQPESELYPTDVFPEVQAVANTTDAALQGFRLYADTARTQLLGVLVSPAASFLKDETGRLISPDGLIGEELHAPF